MFWGHLKIFGEYVQNLPQGAYVQPAVTQLKIDFNLPDIFYIDLWPLGPQFMVLSAPEACTIPTTENTFDQHELVADFFKGNVGTGFIEATNGSLWKHLHQTLAPGLTPSIIKGHHATIIEEAVAIRRHFWDIAKSGKTADIRHELGHYPFKVMGNVLLNETLSEQIYEDICAAFDVQAAINSTNNPVTKWRLVRDSKRLWKCIETALEPRIRARFTALQQQDVAPTKSSVTGLLDRMMLSDVQSGRSLGNDNMRLMLDKYDGYPP